MESLEKPEGGVDYPRNFNEFETFFENEIACREYVTKIRTPDLTEIKLIPIYKSSVN